MNVFDLRDRLVGDYASYTRSFIKIADPRIAAKVDNALNAGRSGRSRSSSSIRRSCPAARSTTWSPSGTLHPECARIFRIDKSDTDHTGKQLLLHTHQREAILKAKEGKSYVLTSGTGSGKSLTYIVPIVDHVLRHGSGRGIQAIVVYPMNALANSQDEELRKFLEKGYPGGQAAGPLRALHRPGEGRRARGDPQQSAGHPAHQLHDAGAAADAHARIASWCGPRRGCAFWSSTSCTPTAAARARTWRC